MFLSFSAIIFNSVLADENVLHIKTTEDLINFSNNVRNTRSAASGTTVLLDNDIYFSDDSFRQFEPIGENNNGFWGTFDGQGHIIRNLKMTNSSEYVGLFVFVNETSIHTLCYKYLHRPE